MSSRTRVLKALNHEEPDRCPTYTWMNELTVQRLAQHLNLTDEPQAGSTTDIKEAMEDALGIDRWRRVRLPIEDADGRSEQIERLVPEQFRDMDNVSINSLGCVVKHHPDVAYLEDVIWHPLQEVGDTDEVDEYPFPAPEAIDLDQATVDRVNELKKTDAVVVGQVQQPFRTACRLRGMENALCDLLVNQELIERIYDRLYTFNTAYCVALARAGVDVVQVVGDIAMQDRLMMSPSIWRRFDKPRLGDLIAEVKRANPNTHVYMHSDGKVIDIIPDLVEIGLDILNPIQPECQDPVEVKQKWGDRLVLHGTVSTQRTLPLGTPQDVEAEVRHLLRHCSRGGGFVIGPANVLIAEFPTENIVAMYQTVSEYYS